MRFASVDKPHFLTSYKVAYRIAKAMKPHTLAKEVIKPCVVDMADVILGNGAARKLKQAALSNDTVRRRINDLNIDIRDQLMSDLKTSPLRISLPLDESTDVFNYSQLICFVHYIKKRKLKKSFCFVNHYQGQQPQRMYSNQGCGSGYFSTASAFTPIASASTNKTRENDC